MPGAAQRGVGFPSRLRCSHVTQGPNWRIAACRRTAVIRQSSCITMRTGLFARLLVCASSAGLQPGGRDDGACLSPALAISDEDRATLESWTRSRPVTAGHAERADRAGGGRQAGTSGTARRPGVKWRDRGAAHGIAGLDDEQRSGRSKVVDDSAIIAATLEPPPDKLGVTHWSSRLLDKHLGHFEVFFGTITRQAIHRGSFDSVTQLVAAIRTYSETGTTAATPFSWTKTADEVLPHATRKRGSGARHQAPRKAAGRAGRGARRARRARRGRGRAARAAAARRRPHRAAWRSRRPGRR